MKHSTFDFNKELIFGEAGAILGAPLAASIASKYTAVAGDISSVAVVGAVVGAAICFLGMRIFDEKRNKNLSIKDLAGDLAYFTPVAFVLTLLVYYPLLFFISRHFLAQGDRVVYTILGSQLVAFAYFLLAINIYRALLIRYVGKRL